jgi:hypothetical protein
MIRFTEQLDRQAGGEALTALTIVLEGNVNADLIILFLRRYTVKHSMPFFV